MKKILLIFVFFLNLLPVFHDGTVSISLGPSVSAQPIPCPPNPGGGGGSGGFWNAIGNFFSGIGNAIGDFFSSIGRWFSGTSGTGGEAYGNEGGDLVWDPQYYPDPSYGPSGSPFDVSTDPFFDPYVSYFSQFYGGGGDLINPSVTPDACPSVTFSDSTTGNYYGFDNFSSPTDPFVSVASNEETNVKPIVNPSALYTQVFYRSQNMAVAILPNDQTSGDLKIHAQNLTIKDEVEVQARCGSIDGTKIGTLNVVVYPKVYKTVLVSCVNSAPSTGYAGFTSNDINDATLQDFLNLSSYNQGVVSFTVFRQSNATITFDGNQDGMLAIGSYITSEQSSIVSQLKTGSYDTYLFYVNNPSNTSINGQSPSGAGYSFIYTNVTPRPLTTVVHEIGHALFSLPDLNTYGDTKNFMWWIDNPDLSRFRKSQWDAMH